MRKRWITIALFVVISSVYFATAAGITSSNDGSHYALLRAIVDEGRFEIETYYDYTEGNDYSEYQGRQYSDRPPGNALFAIPFYALGRILPGTALAPISGHDAGNPTIIYVLLFPALAATGVALLLYRLLRMYELSTFAALTATLAFSFGSLNWKYGGVLFSHALSGLLILSGVLLALMITRKGQLRWPLGLLLGFILAATVVVEYSNAIYLLIVLAYLGLVLNKKLVSGERWWLPLLTMFIGGMIPTGFLLMYNMANFGGPFTTSYTYAVTYTWAHSFASTFDMPLRRGLLGLLWTEWDTTEIQIQGIFLLMPITIVGLFGLWPYIKRHSKEAALLLSIFTVYLLLFARHHTFGGFTGDGRYMVPFLGLWFVPLGFALDRITVSNDTLKGMLWFSVYGLLFLSMRNMLAHIAFSYNYHLDPGLLARQAATPENWSYILSSIFVNVKNLPLLWMFEAIILGIIYALSRLQIIGANRDTT